MFIIITNLGLFAHHYVQYCSIIYKYKNTNWQKDRQIGKQKDKKRTEIYSVKISTGYHMSQVVPIQHSKMITVNCLFYYGQREIYFGQY